MDVCGLSRLLRRRKPKPAILVINHHRVGDAGRDVFDRGVFSASEEDLDAQVAYVQKHFSMMDWEEMSEVVTGRRPLDRFCVAFTFDDGYLDNYTTAFPILRARACPGFFFLVPEYVGTSTVPWWDAIAYMIRFTKVPQLHLSIPEPWTLVIDGDRERAIHAALTQYKRPDNTRGEDFLAELEQKTECKVPAQDRRFLSWDEARHMQSAGMTVGSHTVSHRILSQLSEADQYRELRESRAILERELGTQTRTLAYPVGIRTAFTGETQRIASEAGYEASFSFYGGINPREQICPTDLRRTSLETDPILFRNQMLLYSRLGRLPY